MRRSTKNRVSRTRGGRRRFWPSLVVLLLYACSSTDEYQPTMEEYLTIITDLGSYDDEVRRKAVKSIRRHPRTATVDALRTVLKQGSWELRVRVTIATILATWEDETTGEIDKSGLPDLIEALRGPDAGLRRLAVETLPAIGHDAIQYVKDVVTSGGRANRTDAAVVLGMMLQQNQDVEAGRALLETNLTDEVDSEVRMAVLINLAEWEKDDAVDGFINALTDPHEDCRAFAWVQILGRARPPVAFDPGGDSVDDTTALDRAESIKKVRSWWKKEKPLRYARSDARR